METYAFDPLHTNPDNFIEDEQHSLNTYNSLPYYFIIPRHAPFHTADLSVFRRDGNNLTELTEGDDFNFVLPYAAATRSTGLPIYGGISFNSGDINTTVEVNYRTLGGTWTNDSSETWRLLAEQAYNPRFNYYDQVTNKPDIFPVTQHNMVASELREHEVIIQSVSSIARAIQSDGPMALMQYLVTNKRDARLEELEIELAGLKSRIYALENP
jgi:hypothetical protein